jgi:acyl-coenzyme A synthetase/AMP-(fatty) acid ligase
LAASRVAAFKVPVTVFILPHALPRNAAGKIVKADVKALVLTEPAA